MTCVIKVTRKSNKKVVLLNIDNVQMITPENAGCRVKFLGKDDAITIEDDIDVVAARIKQAR